MWEVQRVEKLRAGRLRDAGIQHRFPLAVSLMAYPACKGGLQMAAEYLLPEGKRARAPKVYADAAVVAGGSWCATQGGGTAGPVHNPPQTWQDNAAVAFGAEGGYGKGAGQTHWDPDQIDLRDPDATAGQGWWWDHWIIACMNGVSHAAVHHDAFPEMMTQWAPGERDGMTYAAARRQGLALCQQAISPGFPRGGELACLGVRGCPLHPATPRAAVRKVVDDIAGEGCVEYLIQTYLCWGHCRVVLQLPLPPAERGDLNEIKEGKGGGNHQDCDNWHRAMVLCMKWYDTDRKMQHHSSGTGFNRNIDLLASRDAACPPLMLAWV